MPNREMTTIQVDSEVRKALEDLAKGKKIEKKVVKTRKPTPNDILREKLGLNKK